MFRLRTRVSIADPQREERLRRMEEQMRSIRGFRGEGQTLRGEEPGSSSLGQRQLRESIANFSEIIGQYPSCDW